MKQTYRMIFITKLIKFLITKTIKNKITHIMNLTKIEKDYVQSYLLFKHEATKQILQQVEKVILLSKVFPHHNHSKNLKVVNYKKFLNSKING